jgi:hypothetical protein
MCKNQGIFLGLLAPPLLLRTCKTPKFNAASLFLGYFQANTLQPVIEPILEALCISLICAVLRQTITAPVVAMFQCPLDTLVCHLVPPAGL